MLLYVIKSKLQSLSKVQGLIDWLFSVARGGKMGGGGGGELFPVTLLKANCLACVKR